MQLQICTVVWYQPQIKAPSKIGDLSLNACLPCPRDSRPGTSGMAASDLHVAWHGMAWHAWMVWSKRPPIHAACPSRLMPHTSIMFPQHSRQLDYITITTLISARHASKTSRLPPSLAARASGRRASLHEPKSLGGIHPASRGRTSGGMNRVWMWSRAPSLSDEAPFSAAAKDMTGTLTGRNDGGGALGSQKMSVFFCLHDLFSFLHGSSAFASDFLLPSPYLSSSTFPHSDDSGTL
ncbi:hypothetical protein LY76DRAFT_205123 [Colletotrichum caudatum]|nr:hypothetical protein LY76DRAFT_205123 [Colletotrichum caudatum]